MATEFYNSIPEGIREKLSEYISKYSKRPYYPLEYRKSFFDMFTLCETLEGFDFWMEQDENGTFPIWNEEQKRFINP